MTSPSFAEIYYISKSTTGTPATGIEIPARAFLLGRDGEVMALRDH